MQQIVGGLHFDQARCGARKRAVQAAAGVQRHRWGGGGAHQIDVAVVQLVDQVDEALCGVFIAGIEGGDVAQQHGMKFAGNFDVVGGAARAFAQRGKVEPA